MNFAKFFRTSVLQNTYERWLLSKTVKQSLEKNHANLTKTAVNVMKKNSNSNLNFIVMSVFSWLSLQGEFTFEEKPLACVLQSRCSGKCRKFMGKYLGWSPFSSKLHVTFANWKIFFRIKEHLCQQWTRPIGSNSLRS